MLDASSPRTTPVRIILADDQAIFRDAVRLALEAEGGFSVVGEACDGEQAVANVEETSPDLLLLDLKMPRFDGLDTLRELQARSSPVKTVLLTGEVGAPEAFEAVTLGARGVLLKDAPSRTFFECLHTVAGGRLWYDRQLVESLTRFVTPSAPRDSLTSREREIVAAVVEGRTNRDIGHVLGISEQTVKNHVRQIFDKLGVSTRLELALYAVHHTIVSAEHAVADARLARAANAGLRHQALVLAETGRALRAAQPNPRQPGPSPSDVATVLSRITAAPASRR